MDCWRQRPLVLPRQTEARRQGPRDQDLAAAANPYQEIGSTSSPRDGLRRLPETYHTPQRTHPMPGRSPRAKHLNRAIPFRPTSPQVARSQSSKKQGSLQVTLPRTKRRRPLITRARERPRPRRMNRRNEARSRRRRRTGRAKGCPRRSARLSAPIRGKSSAQTSKYGAG